MNADTVYALHVNDEVLAAGVPGVVQGRMIGAGGEVKVMVAIRAKDIHLLPEAMQLKYHGGPFVLVLYPLCDVVKKDGNHA